MSGRVERPDLDGMSANLCPTGSTSEDRCMDWHCVEVRPVIAYALALEQDAAALQERLREIEWDPEATPPQCAWCLGFQETGHHDGCKFAAILAAPP